MKTAVSIPDAIFKKAERFAKANRMSRSELYAKAIARLLDERPVHPLTEAYNAAFDDDAQDTTTSEHARRSLLAVEWDDS